MRKVTKVKWLLTIAIVVGVPLIMIVVAYMSHGKTTCIFDTIGIQCFGCNILGALNALKQGLLLEAFRLNALVFVWIGLGIILIANEVYVQLIRMSKENNKQESLIDKLIKVMFRGINFEEE